MKCFLLENFSIFIETIVNIFTLILLFCFLIHIFKTQKNIAFAMLITYWSGRQDLNLQPLGPKPSALPS